MPINLSFRSRFIAGDDLMENRPDNMGRSESIPPGLQSSSARSVRDGKFGSPWVRSLIGRNSTDTAGSSTLDVERKEVKERRGRGVYVEIDVQGGPLGALQAQRCQVTTTAGYHRSMFWGRNDRLAPIPAHVSQGHDGPCVLIEIMGDVLSDPRKDLWG